MTTATIQNITEAHKTAMSTMAANKAVAGVWIQFASVTGPMVAKIDTAGNMHHVTHVSRFANEDEMNEWIQNLEW